ncbi:MAG: NBR1-Ig-like domain-containing protein [Actinomycetota bacterium]
MSTTATDDGLVRATVDGVTLRYPERRFSRVEAAQSEGDDVTLLLVGAGADGFDAELSVRIVRDRTGEFVESATTADRDAVGDLEAIGTSADVVQFVNGSGVRRVDGSEYSFQGLTATGTHLVEIDAVVPGAAEEDAAIAVLDDLARSVFVDVAADALTDGCVVSIEVSSAVALDPGASVAPGEQVTATWANSNVGTCAWTAADRWVFTGGDPVTILDVSAGTLVEPGDDNEVVISFLAPEEPGRYTFQWQFLPAGGRVPAAPVQPVSIEVRDQ